MHLWGLGKTAIWLQKCGFTKVLGTLAGSRGKVGGMGGVPCGGEVNSDLGPKVLFYQGFGHFGGAQGKSWRRGRSTSGG